MKKTIYLFFSLAFIHQVWAQDNAGLTTVKSSHNVAQTTQRLSKILIEKGMKIFATIDHAKNAQAIGIKIPDTTLIIFGNPKIGSKLMHCQTSIAIDLPMKILISEDDQHDVGITYNNPSYLKNRHQVQGCDKVFSKVSQALAKITYKAAN